MRGGSPDVLNFPPLMWTHKAPGSDTQTWQSPDLLGFIHNLVYFLFSYLWMFLNLLTFFLMKWKNPKAVFRLPTKISFFLLRIKLGSSIKQGVIQIYELHFKQLQIDCQLQVSVTSLFAIRDLTWQSKGTVRSYNRAAGGRKRQQSLERQENSSETPNSRACIAISITVWTMTLLQSCCQSSQYRGPGVNTACS